VALSARLEIRQGQGLVITPQLQQAIKLLQMSNIELEAFVETELERNPLLQRDESEAQPEEGGPDEAPAAAEQVADAEARADLDAAHDEASPGERATGDAPETMEMGAADAGGSIDWSKAGSGGSFERDGEGMEGALSRELTLCEHLSEQLSASGLSPSETAIAHVLIDAVDEGGYLRAETPEVAMRLGCAVELVEKVLASSRASIPVGVAARDVRECLMLQLKDKNRYDPAIGALLDNLPLLARRDLTSLKKACGVDDEDLREMIAEIRGLTPRPGAAFGGEPATPVQPDVFVKEGPGGLWHVELNSDTLPRLLVDHRYHARVSGQSKTDQEKTFVTDCLAQANWLMKSLDQRARTILKVSSEIVRQQDAFLAFGVQHLRPLNLKTVAEAIGMHESTVSRVTSNKYMATRAGCSR
jgi:RNA polymerase sigma-54 factor